jgi:Raf kinase inhibitor-like YbhB/YbcL family protein
MSISPDGGGGDGGVTIPYAMTCANADAGGYGISPELDWSGAPAGTMSFTIVFRDLTNGFYHWAIWDIPPTVMMLPADFPAGRMLTMPAGAMQDSFMGTMGQFTGPCPAGGLHVYQFEIFAIPTANLKGVTGTGEARVASVFAAAKAAAIGDAFLTGRSNAKHY